MRVLAGFSLIMLLVPSSARADDKAAIKSLLDKAIQAAGGVPFLDYQVPQAVIKLKQGFGRLIRTSTDSGLVVIFDPRVLTKGYGRAFLQALPECRQFVDGVEQKPAPELPF